MNNVDQVKTRARGLITDQIDRRTTDLGGMVGEHVSNLRAMGSTLRDQGLKSTAGYVDYAADRLQSISTYLTQTEADRMIHDVENIARQQTLLIGALGFIGGLTAARLLKASASSRYREYGSYGPDQT